MGISAVHFNIPPKDFWSLSFCEFYSIFYTKFPPDKLKEASSLTDDEKNILKEAEQKYLSRQ